MTKRNQQRLLYSLCSAVNLKIYPLPLIFSTDSSLANALVKYFFLSNYPLSRYLGHPLLPEGVDFGIEGFRKMGKNQTHKAMQRSRSGSSSAGPDQVEDGMMDGSFHSPEWHAARLASLKTSHTLTWEEFKQKQKEDEIKKGLLEADTDRMMKEYRAQLDAERSLKLAKGRNHSSSKLKHKKERREKDSSKRSSKRKRSSMESSDSRSSSSSDEEEGRDAKKSRSKSRRKKDNKHRRQKASSSEGEESDGPVRLSRFFGNAKR